MDLDKREILIEYYDLYKDLLTKKQRLYFEGYYFLDLSFSELALNFNVSRNAVFDQLKKVTSLLEEYEEILKLNKKYKEILNLVKEDHDLKEKIENIIEE